MVKAKEAMRDWTTHERQNKLSVESRERFNAARKDDTHFDDLVELRMALLDFIADFANWDNSTDAEYLATSRALTQSAHEALGGIPGTRPLVVDPFAGGGSIPLEALRVGGDAFASDLNPIPVLLNKVILEYIPKYGQRLADEVRKWGQWIKEEAEKELAEFYPKDEDGATPIAYLWARTIISEDPGGGAVPVEVPLMRSLWLSKKVNNRKALRWVRDDAGTVQCETLEVSYANGKTVKVRRPLLEIFSPKSEREVEGGTVVRGSATCPVTGYTTPVASVRKQIKERRGGACDARILSVVTKKPEQQGRYYRLPTEADREITIRAAEELERRKKTHSGSLSLVPDEPTPDTKSHRAVASVQLYGMEKFGDLFTPRQLLALTTLVRLSRQAGEEIRKGDDAGLAEAVVAGMSIALNRQADKASCLARYDTSRENPQGTFARQALPMVWDFCEVNPKSGSGGDLGTAIGWVQQVMNEFLAFGDPGQTQIASADAHPLPDDTAQCFFSDPPYYDAVPYSDLSDFFYVWFKRTLGDRMPELFSNELTDKIKQAVVSHPNRTDERVDFESKMMNAMKEGCRILAPAGIGCIVFAHKSTAGWEAQLQAMVDAGWTMTASWPIDTEMGNRMNAHGTATLSSSVHLVVRPRITNGYGAVGDWRDVLEELPKRIHAWLPHLAEEGVVGADAIFACLGPALEVFSRYDSVEKASGEVVPLREYLEHVWAAVSREALSTVVADADLSGFESDARLSAMWLWTVAGGNSPKDEGRSMKDEGKRKGKKNRAQMDLFAELMDEPDILDDETSSFNLHNSSLTTLDRVHQAMILFASGRGEALKRFLVDDGVGQDPGLWKLAQAFSALYPPGTQEKRWVDGVLARKKGLGL